MFAIAIASPIERSDLPGLFKQACGLLAGGEVSVALCDLSGAKADAVTIDALARLQLAARRNGCQIRLINASNELHELVNLMGLVDVLPD